MLIVKIQQKDHLTRGKKNIIVYVFMLKFFSLRSERNSNGCDIQNVKYVAEGAVTKPEKATQQVDLIDTEIPSHINPI